MDIFKEIKKLKFPVEDYVVVGGGSMMARGIKETFDIDLVVSTRLFEKIRNSSWQEHRRPNGESGFENGLFEAYLDVNCGNFNPTFEELRSRADIIDGLPFCCLADVVNFKREYNREKDIKDIQLISNYLDNQIKKYH